ncbi:porin family protein [Aquimarina sp. W85]|uniref:porin family protein n=1 Tax=Aquimarina rhodophyticola TaxID=3342246 RepID=UPI00366C7008
MKRIFLSAIAIFGFSVATQAQDLKFGFKGGVNFATLSGDDVDSDLDGRTGYHIGAVAQVSLMDMIALQPEVLYSAQGVKDRNIDYLNVPVLLKYKFAKVLSIEAGPQFGFVVNDDVKNGAKPESFDFSGAVGAGVEISSFFAQIRYNIGFTEVVENFDGKNSAFQISVGYYIF